MGYVEPIQRWQLLSAGTQQQLRWQAIPKQVADSMAFEGEPVDLAWLTKLHPPTPPLARLWMQRLSVPPTEPVSQ